jgi:hypothetical protein
VLLFHRFDWINEQKNEYRIILLETEKKNREKILDEKTELKEISIPVVDELMMNKQV